MIAGSTTTTKEQTEAFLKAWDGYLIEVETTFLAEVPHKKQGISKVLPKKFNSLKEADRCFQSYIKPVVERFLRRNPSIHRSSGEPKDIEIYNRYADRCPYLLKPYLMGKHQPVPPRIKIYTTIIENKHDVWLIVKSYPETGGGLAELLEELTSQWKDYQDLILALVERDEAVQDATPLGTEQSTNERAKPSAKLRLIVNGSTAHWGTQFLPIRGKHFDILRKLAQRPGEVVIHHDLYSLINSEYNKDLLLRHYINSIRKAFPAPYNDPNHPEGVIKTRRMEGYYLNLPASLVEIV